MREKTGHSARIIKIIASWCLEIQSSLLKTKSTININQSYKNRTKIITSYTKIKIVILHEEAVENYKAFDKSYTN